MRRRRKRTLTMTMVINTCIFNVLSIYYASSTVMITALRERQIIHPHRTDEETEDRRDVAQEHKARMRQSQAQTCTRRTTASLSHLSLHAPNSCLGTISVLHAFTCYSLWETLPSSRRPADSYPSFRTHSESPFQETCVDAPSKVWLSCLDPLRPGHGPPLPQHSAITAIGSEAAQGHGSLHIQLGGSTDQWEHVGRVSGTRNPWVQVLTPFLTDLTS